MGVGDNLVRSDHHARPVPDKRPLSLAVAEHRDPYHAARCGADVTGVGETGRKGEGKDEQQ